MVMKIIIAKNIKNSLPTIEDIQIFSKIVEQRFRSIEKSLAGTLMAKLIIMKYNEAKGMQEHILEMNNIAARLQTLGMKVDKSFII